MEVLLVVLVVFLVYRYLKNKGRTNYENNYTVNTPINTSAYEEDDEVDLIDNKNVVMPYGKRDDFLSKAEKSFYYTLRTFVKGEYIICPKVGIKDIVFVSKSVGSDYMKYFNSISRKHVDFTICDSKSLDVVCCVELDDRTHQKQDRKERDELVDDVFKKANVPLFHIPLKYTYSLSDFNEIVKILKISGNKSDDVLNEVASTLQEPPKCPKCGLEMIKRKATRGEKKGIEFWGCKNYPRCTGVINIEVANNTDMQKQDLCSKSTSNDITN